MPKGKQINTNFSFQSRYRQRLFKGKYSPYRKDDTVAPVLKKSEIKLSRPLVLIFYIFLASIPFENALYATGLLSNDSSSWSISRMTGLTLLFFSIFEAKKIFRAPSIAVKAMQAYFVVYLISAGVAFLDHSSIGVTSLVSIPFMILIFVVCSGIWKDRKARKHGLIILMAAIAVVAVLQLGGLSKNREAKMIVNSQQMREAAFGDDPNFRGVQYGTGLIIAVLVLANVIPGGRILKIAGWGFAGACSLALVQTGSRGAVIACIIGLSFLWFNKLDRKNRWVMALIALVAVSCVIVIIAYNRGMTERFQATAERGDTSGRIVIYKEALGQFLRDPILGQGPYVNTRLLGVFFNQKSKDTHNTFLWVLTANGLIGFLFFFISVAFCLLKAFARRVSPEGMIAITLGMEAIVFSQSASWHLEKMFWVLLALGGAITPYLSGGRRLSSRRPGISRRRSMKGRPNPRIRRYDIDAFSNKPEEEEPSDEPEKDSPSNEPEEVGMAGISVAMVAPWFPIDSGAMDGGGLASSTYYLVRALNDLEGVHVTVVRPYSLGTDTRTVDVGGIEVLTVATRSRWAALHDEADRKAVFEALDRIAPDVVHFQALPGWSNSCPYPSVVTIHGIAERDALILGSRGPKALMKYIYLALRVGRARRTARNVIAISPYTRRYLGREGCYSIWDIPNPVADDFFKVSRRPCPGRVFCSSKISPLKNTHMLIEAISLVARRIENVELVLAGSEEDSSYSNKCRRIAKNLGVTEHVKFLGVVPMSQIMTELSLASCFALCSLQENAPMCVAEAMAAGVPVVSGDVGALSWMTGGGATGRLVDSNSADSIAEGLLEILEKKTAGGGDSQIKERARQMFDPETVARNTLSAYQELMERESNKITISDDTGSN